MAKKRVPLRPAGTGLDAPKPRRKIDPAKLQQSHLEAERYDASGRTHEGTFAQANDNTTSRAVAQSSDPAHDNPAYGRIVLRPGRLTKEGRVGARGLKRKTFEIAPAQAHALKQYAVMRGRNEQDIVSEALAYFGIGLDGQLPVLQREAAEAAALVPAAAPAKPKRARTRAKAAAE